MEFLHKFSAVEKIAPQPFPKESRQYKIISSPIGPLLLIAQGEALIGLSWGADIQEEMSSSNKNNSNATVLTQAEKQLHEYFRGERQSFDLPLEPEGTSFQKLAWQELQKIPYGQTLSYGEQARRLGNPKASRAVGAANGKNPIGIIIPCHRVIGASGKLTGFAGGLEIKQWLLDHELGQRRLISK